MGSAWTTGSLVCPACQATVPQRCVPMAEGVGRCPGCGAITRLSDLLDGESLADLDIDRPPSGCSLRRIETSGGPEGGSSAGEGRIRLVATRRSLGVAASTGAFALAWNGFVSFFVFVAATVMARHLGFIASIPEWMDAKSESSVGRLSWWGAIGLCCFLLPFILVGAAMLVATLNAIIGHVVVEMDRDGLSIASRIGPIGRTRRCPTSSLRGVRLVWRLSTSGRGRRASHQPVIEIAGDTVLSVGAPMHVDRMRWLAAAIWRHARTFGAMATSSTSAAAADPTGTNDEFASCPNGVEAIGASGASGASDAVDRLDESPPARADPAAPPPGCTVHRVGPELWLEIRRSCLLDAIVTAAPVVVLGPIGGLFVLNGATMLLQQAGWSPPLWWPAVLIHRVGRGDGSVLLLLIPTMVIVMGSFALFGALAKLRGGLLRLAGRAVVRIRADEITWWEGVCPPLERLARRRILLRDLQCIRRGRWSAGAGGRDDESEVLLLTRRTSHFGRWMDDAQQEWLVESLRQVKEAATTSAAPGDGR